MVTGRTVIAEERAAPAIVRALERHFRDEGLRVELGQERIAGGGVRIYGEGSSWKPRHYVACITRLFEACEVRCLIGTRGLLGEGWDAVALNTLIDLTVAGTYATVNQVRGRSIRLDPNWERKVANNWDVVCLAPDWEEGRADLRRMMRKHEHIWGLGPSGRIIKGPGHVDERLLFLADASPIKPATTLVSSPRRINAGSLKRARRREDAYEDWGVGEPYENFEFSAAVLEAPNFRMKTAFTFGKSLKRILNLIAASLLYYGLFVWQFIPAPGALSGPLYALLLVIAVVLPIALTAPLIRRYVRAAFLELPVDSYLADFGKAVAEALRDTGIAPASPDQVRVVEAADGTYDVHIDAHDEETAELFAEAYEELFDPPLDQRYLISRDQASLSGAFYGPLFRLGRIAFAPFRRRNQHQHPVPTVFGRNKERAQAFATAWKRWVGGGELTYTRSTEGARILLNARVDADLDVDSRTVAEWR